jgi:hypothetical protein
MGVTATLTSEPRPAAATAAAGLSPNPSIQHVVPDAGARPKLDNGKRVEKRKQAPISISNVEKKPRGKRKFRLSPATNKNCNARKQKQDACLQCVRDHAKVSADFD